MESAPTVRTGYANVPYSCRRAPPTRVTFGQVLPCRKAHLAPYIKPEKALLLKVDDIDRTQLLVRRAHVGSCPSLGRRQFGALSASEG